jgi:hypothetical protein
MGRIVGASAPATPHPASPSRGEVPLGAGGGCLRIQSVEPCRLRDGPETVTSAPPSPLWGGNEGGGAGADSHTWSEPVRSGLTPLRAPLGAARQALLASPARGEVRLGVGGGILRIQSVERCRWRNGPETLKSVPPSPLWGGNEGGGAGAVSHTWSEPVRSGVTPLRAPLGAARQALLASPARGEVNPVHVARSALGPNLTRPLEGRAREGVAEGLSPR